VNEVHFWSVHLVSSFDHQWIMVVLYVRLYVFHLSIYQYHCFDILLKKSAIFLCKDTSKVNVIDIS